MVIYYRLAFFKAAYALFEAEFYVKADDDIYLRPGAISFRVNLVVMLLHFLKRAQ